MKNTANSLPPFQQPVKAAGLLQRVADFSYLFQHVPCNSEMSKKVPVPHTVSFPSLLSPFPQVASMTGKYCRGREFVHHFITLRRLGISSGDSLFSVTQAEEVSNTMLLQGHCPTEESTQTLSILSFATLSC